MTELSREAMEVAKTIGLDGWLDAPDVQILCAAIYESGAKSERAVSDRLLEALKKLVDRDVTYIGGLATFSYAEIKSARETLAEVEAMRKEKPE